MAATASPQHTSFGPGGGVDGVFAEGAEDGERSVSAGGECEAEDCGVCEIGLPEADVMDGMHDDGGHDKMYGMVQGETVDIRRRARAIQDHSLPTAER